MSYKDTYIVENKHKYVGDSGRVVYRSAWEYKVMRRLDTSPDVKWWSSENLVIPYALKRVGRDGFAEVTHHRYFPDFVACFNTGGKEKTVVIEVKPQKETVPPVHKKGKKKSQVLKEELTYAKNKAKWEAARKFCAEKGWEFKILTEKEIGHTSRPPTYRFGGGSPA